MALALLLTRPMFLEIMNKKCLTKDWMWHSVPWSDVDMRVFGHRLDSMHSGSFPTLLILSTHE